jgi:hypothetical protein
MLIKVSSKESYGINMRIQLLKGSEKESQIKAERVGNTEIMYATVKKGQTYHIELDYTNSIIQLSSFFDCPNAHLQISMIQTDEALDMIKEQNQKPNDVVKKDTKNVRN